MGRHPLESALLVSKMVAADSNLDHAIIEYMPAKDMYHDAVVNALIADEWKVVQQQFYFRFGKRLLVPDILAWRQDVQYAFIEVKGFDDTQSPVTQLHNAIGQYLTYRAALEAT